MMNYAMQMDKPKIWLTCFFSFLISTIPATYAQTSGSCTGLQIFKATTHGENTTQYNAWVAAIGEPPDNLVNFEAYSVGDNLAGIVLGPGFIWTNLEGGYIQADNDIGSAPPIGNMASEVDADGSDNGDNSQFAFSTGVDYVGLYIIDLNNTSLTSTVRVTFSDASTCDITIDHTAANCQCEEFMGLVAPTGKKINTTTFLINGGSKYGMDNIGYGTTTPPNCTINSPTITPVCDNAGTTSTGGDDTFTFTVSTTGSGVGGSYIVKDGTTVLGTVNYGVNSATFGPFLISGGLRQLTLEDSITGTCTRPAHANPPAPCSAGCTTLMNCTEVTALIGVDPNSTPNNGANTEDDYACYAVSVCTPPSSADLELTKTSNNVVIRPGDTMTFTLTLVNKGPSTANAVVVRDVIPAGLTFVSATTATGSYSNATGLWTVGDIAPGTYTLTINVTVN